jgi:hypothetical protein
MGNTLKDLLERVEGATPWNNHLPLLYLALEETQGIVIEMGCGDGSTQWLHDYCGANNRKLYSFDNSKEWAAKYMHCINRNHIIQVVENWDVVHELTPSVVLIDHSPGERRATDAKKFKDIEGVLILHDTEPPPRGGNYGWEEVFPLFKYRCNIQAPSFDGVHSGVGATAVSNTVDVTKWIGKQFGSWKVE